RRNHVAGDSGELESRRRLAGWEYGGFELGQACNRSATSGLKRHLSRGLAQYLGGERSADLDRHGARRVLGRETEPDRTEEMRLGIKPSANLAVVRGELDFVPGPSPLVADCSRANQVERRQLVNPQRIDALLERLSRPHRDLRRLKERATSSREPVQGLSEISRIGTRGVAVRRARLGQIQGVVHRDRLKQ